MRYSIAAASLFSTSALAVLYPGQSNVNHTCQLSEHSRSMRSQLAIADTVYPQPTPTPYYPAPVPPTLTPSIRAAPKRTEDSSSPPSSGLHTLASSLKVNCCLPTIGRCTDCGRTSAMVGARLPARWTILIPFTGSYTQYCDLSRQYDRQPSPNTTNSLPNGTVVPAYKGPSIETFVQAFGKYDLLAWMNKYWINQGAPNHEFYEHEFSKHGTCFSTFDVPCYGPEYVEHEEVVQFFETAILYYRRLPTFGWLNAADITPSNTTTYSLGQFQNALTKGYGALPYIGCSGPRYNETAAGKGSLDNGRTQISETWYYFHVSVMKDGKSNKKCSGQLINHCRLSVSPREVLGFLPTPLALSPPAQRHPMPSATLSVPTALPGVFEVTAELDKSLETIDGRNV
jgi:ribonuclease T2